MRPQVGQVINNKYRLIRLIGDGGMGSVYEARHEVLGTTVALKFLHPELSRRTGLVQRFLQEARVSAQIQSPHVVRVSDVDQTTGGLAFIVMEYLEGKTLQTVYEDLYRAGVRLSYADALEYAMQMIEGVEAAHRTGVVHRDLKPDNVIITKTAKGEPLLKLLDFGIAKLKVTGQFDRGLTRPGVIMGTPEYMAPEQAYSADTVDARADIFSLGVMIFEMLAGRRPVGGDEPHSIAAAYLAGQISKLSELAPGTAPELCAAIHRAMAPMPADRFPELAGLREAIEPFAKAARAPSAMTPAPAGTSQPQASDAVAPAAVPPTADGSNAAALESPAMSPVPEATPSPDATGSEASRASEEATRAVPKTIPPEEDAPTAAPPVGALTPLGGFAAEAGSAAAAPAHSPEPTPPPMPQAGEGEGAGNVFPPTVSAAPYMPPNGASAGTAAAAPSPAPMEMPHRPGGTAVSAAPMFESEHAATPAYVPPPGIPGTASMDPVPPTAPTPAAQPRRPERRGPPLLLILLLAAGISGVAVGGVYLAHEIGRSEEQVDEAPLPPPPQTVSVPSEPPPTAQAGSDPTAPATTTTAPSPPVTAKPPKTPPTTPTSTAKPPPTTPPTTPTTPPTTPTTTPTTPPSGSTRPGIPTLPPIVLPTALPTIPFPLPGLPSATPPKNPNPTPRPSGTGTSSKRPRIPILIPR